MKLHKKYRIVYGEDKVSVLSYDNDFTGTVTHTPDDKTGVDFDTKEEYDDYINANSITFIKTE